MIERDRCEHGDVALDEVGGIPATSHAHLEYTELHRPVREPQVGERGERLEVGHALIALAIDELQEGQQMLVLRGEFGARGVLTADRDPLRHLEQVR